MVYAITGCLGFIGSAFTQNILDRNEHVYGIDAETYASRTSHLSRYWCNRFKYIKDDIATLKTLPDVDIVVNFAAETHVDNSIVGSADFVHSNVLGVQNLLELIRRLPEGSRPLFVHISTDEVYGDTVGKSCPTEESALRPSNPYAATKAAADMLIMSYARTYGIKYKIIRPSNCIGRNQYHEKLVPKYTRHLQLGRKFPVHGNGEQHRSWLYVPHAIDAINYVIKNGELNNIYNIGGSLHSINHILKTVYAAFSSKQHAYYPLSVPPFEDTLKFGTSRAGMDLHYNVDDTKLRNLGWTADIDDNLTIEDMISTIVKFQLHEGVIL